MPTTTAVNRRAGSAVKKPKTKGVTRISLRKKASPKEASSFSKYLPLATELAGNLKAWHGRHVQSTIRRQISIQNDEFYNWNKRHKPSTNEEKLDRTWVRNLLKCDLDTLVDKLPVPMGTAKLLAHLKSVWDAFRQVKFANDGKRHADQELDPLINKTMEVTPEYIAKELEALVDRPNQRFSATLSDYMLKLTSLPVTLADPQNGIEPVELGRFRIILDLRGVTNRLTPDVGHQFAVEALEPVICHGHAHPHVSDTNHLCCGEGEPFMFAALMHGAYTVWADLTIAVLENYNSSSPYISLDEWTGGNITCNECGSRADAESSCQCDRCERMVCDSCYAATDSGVFCDSCSFSCPNCDTVCSRDARRHSAEHNTPCCSGCVDDLNDQESQTDCPHCGSSVDKDDLTTANDGTKCCSECVDDLNDTIREKGNEEEESQATPARTADGKPVFGAPPR